jgi:hypothetical protein
LRGTQQDIDSFSETVNNTKTKTSQRYKDAEKKLEEYIYKKQQIVNNKESFIKDWTDNADWHRQLFVDKNKAKELDGIRGNLMKAEKELEPLFRKANGLQLEANILAGKVPLSRAREAISALSINDPIKIENKYKNIIKNYKLINPNNVDLSVTKNLNNVEKELVSLISKTEDINKLAQKGRLLSGERWLSGNAVLYKEKELLSEKIFDLFQENKNKIQNITVSSHYDPKSGTVIYFDIGGRQVSFHRFSTPEAKWSEADFVQKPKNNPWIGKPNTKNPLQMSTQEYKDFLENTEK